jgi:hypothetical protein
VLGGTEGVGGPGNVSPELVVVRGDRCGPEICATHEVAFERYYPLGREKVGVLGGPSRYASATP